jgi:hypothetical protein
MHHLCKLGNFSAGFNKLEILKLDARFPALSLVDRTDGVRDSQLLPHAQPNPKASFE